MYIYTGLSSLRIDMSNVFANIYMYTYLHMYIRAYAYVYTYVHIYRYKQGMYKQGMCFWLS